MPDQQMSSPSARAAPRPRCFKCRSRMEVQRITAARCGFERWTLRCTGCRHIHEMQVPIDPMKTFAQGWLRGELKPPR